VSSLISDPCTDTNGKTFTGCDVSTIFPASTYAYRLNMSFDQETFKIWVGTWNGYGDDKQTSTIDSWLTSSLVPNFTQSIGDQCNTTFNIVTYDKVAQTGTIKFSDMSDFKDCNTVFSNLSKAKSTEVKKFKLKSVNGETVMVHEIPLMYVKNNPNDTRGRIGYGLFGAYKGRILDGEYWPVGSQQVIGLDGNQKIGNKNLLDTYLKMTGQSAFPYQ